MRISAAPPRQPAALSAQAARLSGKFISGRTAKIAQASSRNCRGRRGPQTLLIGEDVGEAHGSAAIRSGPAATFL
jgi:hypothetical protein